MLRFVVEGSRVQDIASLYDEFNRLLMADEDWDLGHSLDALHDALHGGFGALAGDEAVAFVWREHEHSRHALGIRATERWLESKLEPPGRFDERAIRRQLEQLRATGGPTYFDHVLNVFAEHERIRLELR